MSGLEQISTAPYYILLPGSNVPELSVSGRLPSGYFYLLGGQPRAGPDAIESRTPKPGDRAVTDRRMGSV